MFFSLKAFSIFACFATIGSIAVAETFKSFEYQKNKTSEKEKTITEAKINNIANELIKNLNIQTNSKQQIHDLIAKKQTLENQIQTLNTEIQNLNEKIEKQNNQLKTLQENIVLQNQELLNTTQKLELLEINIKTSKQNFEYKTLKLNELLNIKTEKDFAYKDFLFKKTSSAKTLETAKTQKNKFKENVNKIKTKIDLEKLKLSETTHFNEETHAYELIPKERSNNAEMITPITESAKLKKLNEKFTTETENLENNKTSYQKLEDLFATLTAQEEKYKEEQTQVKIVYEQCKSEVAIAKSEKNIYEQSLLVTKEEKTKVKNLLDNSKLTKISLEKDKKIQAETLMEQKSNLENKKTKLKTLKNEIKISEDKLEETIKMITNLKNTKKILEKEIYG